MNIKLRNSDYSQNKIDVVKEVVTLKKTDTTAEFALMGTEFSNGQTLRFRVVIDDAGTMAGQSDYPLAFGTADNNGGTTLSYFMIETFPITIQDGTVIEGDITISGITETRIYVKQGFFNAPTGIRSAKWTLQYYIL